MLETFISNTKKVILKPKRLESGEEINFVTDYIFKNQFITYVSISDHSKVVDWFEG